MRRKNLRNLTNRLGVLAYYVEALMAVGFPNEIQTRAIDTSTGFIRILNPGASGSADGSWAFRVFYSLGAVFGILGRHVQAGLAEKPCLRRGPMRLSLLR
jgi:hypothetical protein